MRLTINDGTLLPELPCDIRTFAHNLVKNLELSYGVAREVSVLQHRRSEGRYNECVVAKLYAPGAYVCVLSMDVISAPPRNSYFNILDTVKSSKSKDRYSFYAN